MEFFRRFGPSWWLRLAGLAVLDAVVLALLPGLFAGDGVPVAAVSMLIGTIGINFIFLSAKTYPLRWLVPGLIFLTLLMVWPLIFTIVIATTNWSSGNFITKDQAVESITIGSTYRLEPESVQRFFYRDDATDDVKVLIITGEGDIFFGSPRLSSDPEPEEPVLDDLADFTITDEEGDGIPETIDDYRKLRLIDASSIQNIDDLVLDVPGRGAASTVSFGSAQLAVQRFGYDPDRGVLLDGLTGGICEEVKGSFFCEDIDGDGSLDRLDPGFRTTIGLENFTNLVSDDRYRAPFLRVLAWNLIFAGIVVAIQLALGLALALTFNDRRFRLRNFYRTLLIIPYAAPAFISVLVWRGLFNRSFGGVNKLLESLVGLFQLDSIISSVQIPWLTDGLLAKSAVVIVSVWQGFPYFLLISMGALQSIPTELQEAARVDGASARQVFRKVTFPLLMVSIAPLIIASYAYNFNAFVNIFLLTSGGPPISGYAVPVGETDILISFTFNLAVASGRGGQLALAAAATFFIFFIVATIAAISFRFTRRLETIYGNL